MGATLSRLFVYPVKSLAGIELREAEATARGLRHDRRFMVVDAQGDFVTQRQLGVMARVSTQLEQAQLRLVASDGRELRVPLEPAGEPDREVRVWRDRVAALDLGDEAARFLRAAFGRDLRLVYMPDSVERRVDPSYAGADQRVGFADGYPFLLLGQASLADLGERARGVLSVRRFRPNLLIGGSEPYAEDGWDRVRIGDVAFRLVKPCSRCAIISLDPDAGEPRLPNPLNTLARFRQREGHVYFGQNALLSAAGGTLRVGDGLEVLGFCDPPVFDVPATTRG